MWWVQGIGVIALLLDIFSVQFKFRKQILGMQIAASSTWVCHFFLLGAYAGAAMNSVGIIRSVSYYKWRGRNRPKWVLIGVLVLSMIMTVVTWQGVVSLLPMFAMIVAAFGFWQRNEQRLRLLLLGAVPLWFAYNLTFSSYAGMLSDSLALFSTLIALYRYRYQGVSELERAHLSN